MGFADGIHIKSACMQLWAAAFARLMTSAEAVDPSRLHPALLSFPLLLLAFHHWKGEKRQRRSERHEARESERELLITCFV